MNRRELAADRRELRHDFRRRAGPAEIARDRAAIAVSAEKSSRNRRDWRYDRWGCYDGRQYGYWDRRLHWGKKRRM